MITKNAGLVIETSPETLADILEFVAVLREFGLNDDDPVEGYLSFSCTGTPAPNGARTASVKLDEPHTEGEQS